MKLVTLILFATLLAAVSCIYLKDSATVVSGGPLDDPPVDTARVRSADEAAAWKHRRTLQADLNRDGSNDRIVLTSDVEVSEKGVPIWEDGHRWAVFVEEGEKRTLLYAAFVPNGHAEAGVMAADSEGRRNVLIHERTPQQTRSLVVAYERPGKAKSISAVYYQIEQWLPPLTKP